MAYYNQVNTETVMNTLTKTQIATSVNAAAAALTGTVITKNETALLMDVNASILTAVELVGRERKASSTIQAALKKLADGKRTVSELVQMFTAIPAVQMLAKQAPVKPLKDAPVEAHELWAMMREERRQLDNVVRGMLRGFEHDDFKFSWGSGGIQVQGIVKIEAEPTVQALETGDETDDETDDALTLTSVEVASLKRVSEATTADEPAEPATADEPAAMVTAATPVEPAPAVTARAKSGTADSTTDDVIAAMRGAKDAPAKLTDETEIVQAIVAMTRKQRLQLIAVVNEHSNLEVQGTIRLG